jgi:hypothetical protein
MGSSLWSLDPHLVLLHWLWLGFAPPPTPRRLFFRRLPLLAAPPTRTPGPAWEYHIGAKAVGASGLELGLGLGSWKGFGLGVLALALALLQAHSILAHWRYGAPGAWPLLFLSSCLFCLYAMPEVRDGLRTHSALRSPQPRCPQPRTSFSRLSFSLPDQLHSPK